MRYIFYGTITGCLIVLAVLVLLVLIKAVRGKSLTERMVPINMIGTMVMVMIMLLSILLGESGLLDVALLYSLLSFLAVVVLSKVYIGVDKERRMRREEQEMQENSESEDRK